MATNNGYYGGYSHSDPYYNNDDYHNQHHGGGGGGGGANHTYPSPPPYQYTSGGAGNHGSHNAHVHPNPNPYAYTAAQAPPPVPVAARHPRVLFLISITRPWAVVVPAIAIAMDAWWFATGRLCGGYDSTSDCYLVLWYSMPIAVVSLVWSLATTISTRRVSHRRPGIPSRIQLPVQFVVAGGATACLALLAVHLAQSDWLRYNSLQGGMIALVSMITLVNWLLVGFAAYEWNLDRKYQHQSDSFVL